MATKKQGKRGKPKQFTEEEKKKALKMLGLGFTMQQVAYVLNLNKKTIEDNTTQKERDAARVNVDASLINTAYKMAMEGSERMTIFLLKTRLKWSEGTGDLQVKLEYEKELLKFKQEIGFTEINQAPIEVHLHEAKTPDHERNALAIDYESNTTDSE